LGGVLASLSRSCSSLGLGGSRSGLGLGGCGGGRSLGERYDRLDRDSNGGGSAASPGHGLGRSLGLLGFWCRSTGWSRRGTWVLGELWLLRFLFSNLLRSLLRVSSGLGLLSLGSLLDSRGSLNRCLDSCGGGRLLGRGAGFLELLVNDLGIEGGRGGLGRLLGLDLLGLRGGGGGKD
jgi:hypothetical protein